MSAREVIASTAEDVVEAFAVQGSPGALMAADAILSALRAAGWEVVPREPTAAILRAAAQLDWSSQTDPTWREFWTAMLTAAAQETTDEP